MTEYAPCKHGIHWELECPKCERIDKIMMVTAMVVAGLLALAVIGATLSMIIWLVRKFN